MGCMRALRKGVIRVRFVVLVLLVACGIRSEDARQIPSQILTVASDGSTPYTRVQQAVDAVPEHNQRRVTIRIKPGIYKGRVVIPRTKAFISLAGEDAEKTLLTESIHQQAIGGDGKEVGAKGCATVLLLGDDFSAENISFENASGNIGQALAFYAAADRAVFRGCRFLGWQDTLRVDIGRQYFEQCYICGHCDFIYGDATAWFENCQIHCREFGYITAASTAPGREFGYVFSGCRISAEPGIRKVFLGRPWRPHAAVAWLNTEMCGAIQPSGWDNWDNPANEKTARYAEFNSRGPGAQPLARAKWTRQLQPEQARKIDLQTVLGGADKWSPKPTRED